MFAEGRHILFTAHSKPFGQAYSREQNMPPFRLFFSVFVIPCLVVFDGIFLWELVDSSVHTISAFRFTDGFNFIFLY